MARPQKIYSEEEKSAIKKAYRKCKNIKEQKRLLCLKLRIVKGFSSKTISEIVGYCPSFVDEIISTYNKQGHHFTSNLKLPKNTTYQMPLNY